MDTENNAYFCSANEMEEYFLYPPENQRFQMIKLAARARKVFLENMGHEITNPSVDFVKFLVDVAEAVVSI